VVNSFLPRPWIFEDVELRFIF